MIAEIAAFKPKKAKGSISLFAAMPEPNFIAEAVRRIDEMSLRELEVRVPELIQARGRHAFMLGGMLARVRREKFWNPGSNQPQNALFERWVEETCQFSGRKARYLIAVYVGLATAGIPSSKISAIGWSKLRMIAPLLKPIGSEEDDAIEENEAHNNELIKLAQEKSRKELEAALRSAQPLKNGATPDHVNEAKPRRYVFNVQDGADGVVDAAFEKIAKQTGHTGAAAFVDMAKAINAGRDAPALEEAMRMAGRERSLGTYRKLFGIPERL